MTTIRIMAEGAHAEVISMTGTLTSGMVGATTEFHYGPEWDGLLKTAVFTAGSITRDVVDAGDVVEVPPEVLVKPGEFLRVGVYGYRADGSIVIPTVMVYVGKIMPGADPSGDVSAQPTPTLVQQMMGLTQQSVEASEAAAEDAQAAVNAAQQSANESAQARQAAQETAQNVVDANQFAAAAKLSAGEAKTSEDNAKTSEGNAKTSETIADQSAKTADASAAKAAQSEGNAKTSENNAKLSETAAENAKTTAEQKATDAATSAANAAKSEGNAKTSEANAKAAETDAQAAQAKAEEAAANAETWAKSVHLPQVAKPGQTIIVKAVDENGKPTEWEAADYQEKICGTETGMVEVFTETVLTTYEEAGDLNAVTPENSVAEMVAGKTYTVNWNGTAYECMAYSYAADPVTIAFGRVAELGLIETDTGEPFIGLYAPTVGACMFIVFDGSTEVTLSIYCTAETIQTIPPKYLPEGVPYIEDGGMVEVLPETTLTSSESDPGEFGLMENVPTLVIGEAYTVKWNGTEYTGTAIDGSALVNVPGSVMLVNDDTDMTTGANMLFMIVLMNGGLMFVDPAGSTELTVAIYQGGRTLHKLPNELLDLDWLPKKEAALYTVLPETGLSSTILVSDLPLIELTVGETYLVTYGGIEYSMVGKRYYTDNVDVVYLGNFYLFDQATADTGEPFVLMAVRSGSAAEADGSTFMERAKTEQNTVMVQGTEYVPNKLPAEYLPESVDGVIIRSSTADSTKKFKLTVDDSGTISATEVT